MLLKRCSLRISQPLSNRRIFGRPAMNTERWLMYTLRVSKEAVILKSVTLDVSDLIEIHEMRNVILVKVRDAHLILNINNVLRKEGFYDFQAKYIGVESRSWFLQIGGLPLNAWTPKAFKKIAYIWGEPLFVDDDPHENVAMDRVCIRTKIQGQINETCKVMIHGQTHNARVKEFACWVPDIEAMDSLSGKKSDMGMSDEQDNIIGDNGSLDAEEGEIRETK
ncbi:hypothetical protein Tco_1516242 [Tanacetum coccineum]